MKACKDYVAGQGSFRSIAKSNGVAYATLRQWYLTYKIHSESAFDYSDENRAYSSEFKQGIINEYTSGSYSLAELSAKYNISYSIIRD